MSGLDEQGLNLDRLKKSQCLYCKHLGVLLNPEAADMVFKRYRCNGGWSEVVEGSLIWRNQRICEDFEWKR